jgi:hypothetical protein
MHSINFPHVKHASGIAVSLGRFFKYPRECWQFTPSGFGWVLVASSDEPRVSLVSGTFS